MDSHNMNGQTIVHAPMGTQDSKMSSQMQTHLTKCGVLNLKDLELKMHKDKSIAV